MDFILLVSVNEIMFDVFPMSETYLEKLIKNVTKNKNNVGYIGRKLFIIHNFNSISVFVHIFA